jgi:hypothetical protein
MAADTAASEGIPCPQLHSELCSAFVEHARALLDREPPLHAVTTNRAENAIGQMTTRLKGIGRRWGPEGGLNIVRALLIKIFNYRLWREQIEVYPLCGQSPAVCSGA